MMQTTQIGDRGEQIAAEQLVRFGYQILDRNWKTKWAEIDILAIKQDVLYFVEVKYRSTNEQGDGFDYITNLKLAHMTRAAELWVASHDWRGDYQLLAVAVDGTCGSIEIREIT